MQVLPNFLEVYEWVNADAIALGLSPFNPESVAIQAGKLMLQRLDDLVTSQRNLINLYLPLCDNWKIYDNSSYFSQLIAEKKQEKSIVCYNQTIWADIIREE